MPTRQEPYPFERIRNTTQAASAPFSDAPSYSPDFLRRSRRHFRRSLKIRLPHLLKKSLAALFSRQMLWLLPLGFICARAGILGELYPFGFAFLTAFGVVRKERCLPLAVGMVGGCLSAPSGLRPETLLCYAFLCLILWKLPHSHPYARLLTAAVSALSVFFVKTLLLLTHGIQYYQEMIIVIEALLVFFLAYVFQFCSEALQKNRPFSRFSFEEISSAVLLGGVALLGISDWQLYGVSLCSVLCRAAILYTAYLWGSGGSTMMGVTAGVIPSLTTGLFAQSLSMYAAAGMLSGWFRQLGRLPVIMAFFSGILAVSFYAVPAALTLQSLQESLLAAVLFYFTAERVQNLLPPSARFFDAPSESRMSPIPALSSHARQRIDCLAQVFDEIGGSLAPEEESDPPLSPTGCLNYLYENVRQKLCDSCALKTSCWGHYEKITTEDMLLLFEQAEKQTPFTPDLIPPRFKRRCIRREELAPLINHLYENLRLYACFTEKIGDSRKLIREQLQGVGELIRNLAHPAETIFSNIQQERAEKTPLYRLDQGAAQNARTAACGDSFAFMELEGGKFAAVLSDGMGIGEAAQSQSQTALRILKSMLKSGFALESILQTINSVLLLRTPDESFTTLDLLLLDLSTAEATLIKTAAAPTLIRRRGRTRVIRSGSLPVGILKELEVHQEHLRLEDGDLILLMSDGMLDPFSSVPEEEWMQEILQDSDCCSCQYLADTLLAQALKTSSFPPADDMTILCLRLFRS